MYFVDSVLTLQQGLQYQQKAFFRYWFRKSFITLLGQSCVTDNISMGKEGADQGFLDP